MQFKLVVGPVFSITCQGCGEHKQAGSEPFQSASTGELDGYPDIVYEDLDGKPFASYYCKACAVNYAEYQDDTRSVSKFYADTSGEEIL
jgi:hypothetical protein